MTPASDEGAGFDPWIDAMLREDFESAWKISDQVRTARAGQPRHQGPRHEQVIWDGRPLDGRDVLVRCYHGLGDTLQFIRYLPQVKAIARRVAVWAQPALLPLLRQASGIDVLEPLHDGVPSTPYEVDLEIMELPYIFRTVPGTIPRSVPYLAVPVGLDLPLIPSDSLNVGVIWSAGEWNTRRSIPIAELKPLFSVPGIIYYALQGGPSLAEWDPLWGEVLSCQEVECLAARMAQLDLILTVDSMPAHLAGALGLRTWTLLPEEADWRWLRHRPDSPWYPTMRLFRKSSAPRWGEVIREVANELGQLRR